MPGKTVRIDMRSYELLIQAKKEHRGMSLSDLADIAVQKTYSEEEVNELTNEKILAILEDEHGNLLKAKDDHIQELKETLHRERKLVDTLTKLIEKWSVSKNEQNDT